MLALRLTGTRGTFVYRHTGKYSPGPAPQTSVLCASYLFLHNKLLGNSVPSHNSHFVLSGSLASAFGQGLAGWFLSASRIADMTQRNLDGLGWKAHDGFPPVFGGQVGVAGGQLGGDGR